MTNPLQSHTSSPIAIGRDLGRSGARLAPLISLAAESLARLAGQPLAALTESPLSTAVDHALDDVLARLDGDSGPSDAAAVGAWTSMDSAEGRRPARPSPAGLHPRAQYDGESRFGPRVGEVGGEDAERAGYRWPITVGSPASVNPTESRLPKTVRPTQPTGGDDEDPAGWLAVTASAAGSAGWAGRAAPNSIAAPTAGWFAGEPTDGRPGAGSREIRRRTDAGGGQLPRERANDPTRDDLTIRARERSAGGPGSDDPPAQDRLATDPATADAAFPAAVQSATSGSEQGLVGLLAAFGAASTHKPTTASTPSRIADPGLDTPEVGPTDGTVAAVRAALDVVLREEAARYGLVVEAG